jgi:prevent-host-death family protein
MAQVNVHDAKTHFSKLLERVEAGEEIVIARAGEPIAKLVPLGEPLPRRPFGLLKGQIQMAADFDDPLPEEFWFGMPVEPDHVAETET